MQNLTQLPAIIKPGAQSRPTVSSPHLLRVHDESAWHRMQCPVDTFGIARDDGEVGFCRLVRLGAALFPIPQSAERDVVARGKFLLSQREGAAEGFDARN